MYDKIFECGNIYIGTRSVLYIYSLMQRYLYILLTMQKIHTRFIQRYETEIVLYLALSKNLGFLVDKIVDMTKSVH